MSLFYCLSQSPFSQSCHRLALAGHGTGRSSGHRLKTEKCYSKCRFASLPSKVTERTDWSALSCRPSQVTAVRAEWQRMDRCPLRTAPRLGQGPSAKQTHQSPSRSRSTKETVIKLSAVSYGHWPAQGSGAERTDVSTRVRSSRPIWSRQTSRNKCLDAHPVAASTDSLAFLPGRVNNKQAYHGLAPAISQPDGHHTASLAHSIFSYRCSA